MSVVFGVAFTGGFYVDPDPTPREKLRIRIRSLKKKLYTDKNPTIEINQIQIRVLPHFFLIKSLFTFFFRYQSQYNRYLNIVLSHWNLSLK